MSPFSDNLLENIADTAPCGCRRVMVWMGHEWGQYFQLCAGHHGETLPWDAADVIAEWLSGGQPNPDKLPWY